MLNWYDRSISVIDHLKNLVANHLKYFVYTLSDIDNMKSVQDYSIFFYSEYCLDGLMEAFY